MVQIDFSGLRCKAREDCLDRLQWSIKGRFYMTLIGKGGIKKKIAKKDGLKINQKALHVKSIIFLQPTFFIKNE